MQFEFFNDTNREVGIHPATKSHGTMCNMLPIKPLELRIFTVPEGKIPWIKMWDHGEEQGLVLLVSSKEKERFVDQESDEDDE